MNLPLHGSNPDELYRSLAIEIPERYIDFSVNLNPFGILPNIKAKWSDWIGEIIDYPEPTGTYLKTMIAKQENIFPEQVLLGNGGAQLITLIANFFRKKRVAIVQPTFVEYEKMCEAFECEINHIVLSENKWSNLSTIYRAIKEVDALFLCHPNNPTGITYSEAELTKLIEICDENDCYIIIDEAFHDFVNEPITVAPNILNSSYVIIIRSLTKMYSIAGLRLGYLLGPNDIVRTLETIQPHWSVNAIALKAGILCIKDAQFANKTRQFVTKERHRLKTILQEANYIVSNSKVNFFIIRDPNLDNQLPLIQYLLQRGIVPRHTENFRGLNGRWIRLAIKSEKENNVLVKVLKSWKEI